MSTINDPEQYKAGQRQGWDSVANGWQKWWKTIERGAEKVSRHLIELAEIKEGSKVLDIATGIGEPSITAAHQVGKSGHVLAIDISPEMLSIANKRAISLGIQDVIEFREGDTETINLPMSTFDAALCRFGLMFLPDLGAGFESAEVFTNFVCETAAPIQAVLSKQSQERRTEILKVITDKVANRYTDKTSSSANLSNETICIAGRK